MPSVLTSREREVADLLLEGLSNDAIGERLVIARDTVMSHLHSIKRKLGTRNRTESAVRWYAITFEQRSHRHFYVCLCGSTLDKEAG